MAEPVCAIEPVPESCPVDQDSDELIITPVQPPKPSLKCDPCPCTTLECGAKAVAIFTLLVDILVLLVYIASAIIYGVNKSNNSGVNYVSYGGMARSGSNGSSRSNASTGKYGYGGGYRSYGSEYRAYGSESDDRIHARLDLGSERQLQLVYPLKYYIIQLLMAVGSAILAACLFLGTLQTNQWGRMKLSCVSLYFVGTCILEFVGIVVVLFEIWGGRSFRGYFRISSVIIEELPELILLFITAYFLIVVFCYMKEIKLKLPKPQPPAPNQQCQAGIVRPLAYDTGVITQPVQGSCQLLT